MWVDEEFLLKDETAPNRRYYKGTPCEGVVFGPMVFLHGDRWTGESDGLSQEEIDAVMAEYRFPEEPDVPKIVHEPRVYAIPDDIGTGEDLAAFLDAVMRGEVDSV